MLGILLLLYLANIKNPLSNEKRYEGRNFEGEHVEIKGIVKSQRNGEDYSLLNVGNLTILSEIVENFTNKNITVIGRVHEDIIVADEIRINK